MQYYSNPKRRGAYIAARKAQRARELMQLLNPKKSVDLCGIT